MENRKPLVKSIEVHNPLKTILIVDDDSLTCKMLSRIFEPFSDNFKVLLTENHTEVHGIIANQDIDLVFMDLQIPGINGFQLLDKLVANCPDIPIFVMTAFGTPESRASVAEIPNCRYVEKPLDIDIITDTVFDELEKGIVGQINGIGLSSYLQMVEKEKKTCTLIIRSDGKTGKIYFTKGELMAATTGKLQNDSAVRDIISWHNTVMGVENINLRKTKEIQHPLTQLIIEGLKLKEKTEQKKKITSQAINPPLKKSDMKPVKDKQKKQQKNEPAIDERSKEIIAFLNSSMGDSSGAAPDNTVLSKASIKKSGQKTQPKQISPAIPQKRNAKRTPQVKPSSAAVLSTALGKVKGISAYGIFDRKDLLHEKNTKAGAVPQITPSVFRKISIGLADLLNCSPSNYIVLKTQDHTRHVLFDFRNNSVVMTVKPGFHLHEFMKKIKKAESAATN